MSEDVAWIVVVAISIGLAIASSVGVRLYQRSHPPPESPELSPERRSRMQLVFGAILLVVLAEVIYISQTYDFSPFEVLALSLANGIALMFIAPVVHRLVP